jgi:hypothetical protein
VTELPHAPSSRRAQCGIDSAAPDIPILLEGVAARSNTGILIPRRRITYAAAVQQLPTRLVARLKS